MKKLKMTEQRKKLVLRMAANGPIIVDGYHAMTTARWLAENGLAEVDEDGRRLVVRLTSEGLEVARAYGHEGEAAHGG